MADFTSFAEGDQYLLTHGNGLPATCFFLLSTTAVSSFAAGTTLAVSGVGEITGTGYTRQSQSVPTPSGGTVTFTAMTWSTGSATNWPNNVKSVVLVTSTDNTGKAICAWNLVTGGASRDMSQANTSEQVTPTFSISPAT
jgi:hypothetical protein